MDAREKELQAVIDKQETEIDRRVKTCNKQFAAILDYKKKITELKKGLDQMRSNQAQNEKSQREFIDQTRQWVSSGLTSTMRKRFADYQETIKEQAFMI